MNRILGNAAAVWHRCRHAVGIARTRTSLLSGLGPRTGITVKSSNTDFSFLDEAPCCMTSTGFRFGGDDAIASSHELPTIGGKYFALAVLFAMNLLNYVDRYSFFAAGHAHPE